MAGRGPARRASLPVRIPAPYRGPGHAFDRRSDDLGRPAGLGSARRRGPFCGILINVGSSAGGLRLADKTVERGVAHVQGQWPTST